MENTPFCGRTSNDNCGIGPEDLLRRKLKYFFMNPCQKWKAKKKFPWKLVLQIIKIVLVTVQLWMFGLSRASHIDFLEKSTVSFKHLYLLNWSSTLETLPYPPSSGTFALYEIPAFFASVNYAMQRYEETENIAMGTYQFVHSDNGSTIPHMEMCNSHYELGRNWDTNNTHNFVKTQVTDCFPVMPVQVYNNKTEQWQKVYDLESYLEGLNKSIHFDGVNMISLHFGLRAVHLKHHSHAIHPDCYRFRIAIEYDNEEHDGQMKVRLQDDAQSEPCNGKKYSTGFQSLIVFSTVFDVVVIVISLLSGLLCLRSLFRAQRLKWQTMHMFHTKYHKELDLHDKLEFLNMWYVLIIINDLLTLIGSGFKLAIETEFSHNYEACSVLLGTGSLLVWFGVLRYLGFFEKYNILILTMKKSAPNVLRFLVCAAMFYFGFTVCGWVVLGPYHIKFRYLSSASECLFSLVNGDDMYVTFAAIRTNTYVWWYSRIYLYIFISLFIYVILSVFISVIMDTYETIKNYYTLGFPRSPLEDFIAECQDDAHSLFRSYSTDKFRNVTGGTTCSGFCGCLSLPSSCCKRSEDAESEDIGEYGSLIT